jgi:hypothetical protein
MIAPDGVVAPARETNGALNRVYGHIKRLEQGNPRPGETLRSAAEAQHGVWPLIAAMREAMRRDLGVTESSGADHAVETPSHYGDSTALLRDFEEQDRTP